VTVGESARLAGFMAALTIKERVRPQHQVRPLVAELFLTENCNLRCVSCACWREVTRGELSTEEWKDVLRQLVELPIHKVNFTGGEPLIRKDAVELMRHANAIGIGRIHLNTNAIRLTDTMRTEVLHAGVRSFNVSVDGPDAAMHDRIRGKRGAFEKTIRHLEALIGERERHRLKIRMNFTVMRNNVAALPDVAALAQRLRVRLYLNVATDQTFLFRADEVTNLSTITDEQLREAMRGLERVVRADRRYLPRYSDLAYIRRHFREPLQRNLPCAESQLKLMIHSRGEVGGCWGHDPTHSTRQTAIADVIDSDAYRKEHARLFRKECVGCGANYSLNLRVRPSTYLQDGLWRLHLRSLGSP
jgi:MoaA/NifB/PqqE/SkfB family radical SAM enzyme